MSRCARALYSTVAARARPRTPAAPAAKRASPCQRPPSWSSVPGSELMAATPSRSGPVVVASDHGGYPLKEAIKRHLQAGGVTVIDAGTHSTEAVDYPVFARAAAEAVASGKAWRGVVVDGAGIGSSMTANKVPGVRAGMAFDLATVKNAREHNDANVLTLGAGYLAEDLALGIVDVFLSTDCTAERHRRRVAMIDALDTERKASESTRSSLPMTSPDFDSLV